MFVYISAVDTAAMKAFLSHLFRDTKRSCPAVYARGHFTSDFVFVSQWDTSRSTKCPNCDAEDSRHHRVFECPACEHLRVVYHDVFRFLGSLPETVWKFALTPVVVESWSVVHPLCCAENVVVRLPQHQEHVDVLLMARMFSKISFVFGCGCCCSGSRHGLFWGWLCCQLPFAWDGAKQS